MQLGELDCCCSFAVQFVFEGFLLGFFSLGESKLG